ncbi:reverse transcriptase domain-containing protein [Tanacetum coccineum]
MDECLALADLGASINLMPFSVWEKLSLPDLTPTCMTLELADRSISKPMGIAKDISVKVGVFHFPADFVVVDFEPDPRVPLILGRCFLKTGRALIDVHKGELTLRIGSEAITYNLDQTSRYSANYTHMTANKIDVIDMASILPLMNQLRLNSMELPPHLRVAFWRATTSCPFNIAKDWMLRKNPLSVKVLKVPQGALAWKLSDIQGIIPEFLYPQDLMEED